MLYRNQAIRGMDCIVFPKHIFYFVPEICDERQQLAAFLSGAKQLSCLKVTAEGRAVYLMEDNRVVLKLNRLQGLRRRLIKHLGLFGGGRHYCLTNELANLRRLSGSNLVPRVYGFGRQRRGLLCDEFLLIQYFSSMQTIDEFIKQYPARLKWVLDKVVDLFHEMLIDGFVHLDPHPGNILMDEAGQMCFIDFEFCSFDTSDYSFVLAFSLGYFYHFWFSRFIEEAHYDQIVLSHLAKRDSSKLDARFLAIYQRFKQSKVSRRERYECLRSPVYRRKFESTCSVTSDMVKILRGRAALGAGIA